MPTDPPLRIPPDATEAEAAAISAAVEQLLAEETRQAEQDSSEDPWADRRFWLTGRLEKVTGEVVRVPRGAPANPWAAAGRRLRF